MNSELGQTQPTAQQIGEWFKREFGGEFTPSERQEEWVKEQWDEAMLPLPTMDKERFERYKKGEVMFISGAELGYIEEHLGKSREFKPGEEEQLVEALRKAMEFEDSLRAEFDKDIVTVEDIPPLEWLIEGLVPKKTLYFIGGLPEAGKTSLVLQMAACLMTGQPFLGIPTHHARVLLIENNEPLELVKNRIDKQCDKYPGLQELEIYTGSVKVDSNPNKLRRLVYHKKTEVLFIDTFSDLHNKNENNAGEMGQVLDHLRNLANDFGVTVVCLHHFPRPYFVPGQSKPKGHLRGSIAIEGECDFALGLNKKGSEVMLERIKFRGEYEPIKLKFDSKTVTFEVSGQFTKGKKMAQRQERVQRLLETGKSRREIIEIIIAEFSVGKKTVRRDLEVLGE